MPDYETTNEVIGSNNEPTTGFILKEEKMTDLISAVVVMGVFIFFGATIYKAMREPIDLMGGMLKNGFQWLVEQLGLVGMETVETVTYE